MSQQRLVLLGLLASSGLAWFWPAISPGFDPFKMTEPHLGWGIATIMFAIGCLLLPEELKLVAKAWPHVIAGTIVQYTAMPALAFGVAEVAGFDPILKVGVVMVGCVPGAMASNVLTILARGNASYSVCLTTMSTLLSPIAVPLALWLTLDAQHELNVRKVSEQLLGQVVIPVIAGFVLCRFSAFRAVATRVAGPLANVMILWIIAVVVALNRDRLEAATPLLLAALLAINVGGYLAGYFAGRGLRLPEGMTRALTLEVGMQNCGLGTVLVLQLYPSSEYAAAAIPTAAYTFGCMLTGTILANWWSTRPIDDPGTLIEPGPSEDESA